MSLISYLLLENVQVLNIFHFVRLLVIVGMETIAALLFNIFVVFFSQYFIDLKMFNKLKMMLHFT
jgi:hypothetical protein